MASYKYKDGNVSYSGIKDATYILGSTIGNTPYDVDDENNIQGEVEKVINAIEIDWNNATIETSDGESIKIKSTSDLLGVFKKINDELQSIDVPENIEDLEGGSDLKSSLESLQERVEQLEDGDEDAVTSEQIEGILSDIKNIQEALKWTAMTKSSSDSKFASKVEQDDKGAITVEYSDILDSDVKFTVITGDDKVDITGETLADALESIAQTMKEMSDAIDDAITEDALNTKLEDYPTRSEVTQQIAEAITGDGEISLEGYATEQWVKEQKYETQEHAEATYQPKGDYLTEHQDLTEYAKTSEVEETVNKAIEDKVQELDLSQYETSEHAEETYQKKSDMENYAKTSEVEETVNQAIEDKVQELDLSQYETIEGAEGKYQPKGNYLTEHQSLDGYVKSDELETTLDGYVKSDELETTLDGYVKSDELETTLDGYVKDEDLDSKLEDYVKSDELETTIDEAIDSKVAELDLSQYETSEHADATYQKKGDMSEYQKVSDMEDYQKKSDMDDYVTSDALDSKLEDYPTQSEVTQQIAEAITGDGEISLEGYATEEWVKKQAYETASHAEDTYQKKGDYATKEDVQNAIDEIDVTDQLEDFLTKEDAEDTYQKKGDYATKADVSSSIDAKVQELDLLQYETITGAEGKYQPKGNYLTEHQDLTEYAKTSEVEETVSQAIDSKVEELDLSQYEKSEHAEATYQKKSDMTDYAKTSEVSDAIDQAIDSKVQDLNLSQYETKSHADETYQKKSDMTNYVTDDDIQSALEDYVKDEDFQKALDEYVKSETLETTLDGYETQEHVEATYQPKGDYTTTDVVEQMIQQAQLEGGDNEIDLSSYLLKSEASTTYETINGAKEKYQPKGDYALTSAIEDMATQTWVKNQNYLTEIPEDYVKSDELEQAIEDAKEAIVGEDLKDSLDTLEAIKEWKEKHGTEYTDLVETVNSKLDASAIEDMATKTWVGQQGFAKSDDVTSEIGQAITGLNISQYETITGAEGKYQPLGEYLTEHQSLEGYEKTADLLQKLAEYAKTADVNKTLESYVKTDALETTLGDYATQEWVLNKKYLTEHQSLAEYAKTSEVNSLLEAYAKSSDVTSEISNATKDMATQSWVESKGYLTEHQSLADYANREEINNLLKTYAEKSYVDDKVLEILSGGEFTLDGYLTTTEAENTYQKKSDMSTYATKVYVDEKMTWTTV